MVLIEEKERICQSQDILFKFETSGLCKESTTYPQWPTAINEQSTATKSQQSTCRNKLTQQPTHNAQPKATIRHSNQLTATGSQQLTHKAWQKVTNRYRNPQQPTHSNQPTETSAHWSIYRDRPFGYAEGYGVVFQQWNCSPERMHIRRNSGSGRGSEATGNLGEPTR